jgi:hypothetical protein
MLLATETIPEGGKVELGGANVECSHWTSSIANQNKKNASQNDEKKEQHYNTTGSCMSLLPRCTILLQRARVVACFFQSLK